LLIKREPTATPRSDASYRGLGGWCYTFKFLWRITREELIALGFEMKVIDAMTNEPLDPADPGGLHINVLEFVGLIVNLWIVLYFVRLAPNQPGGHIIELLADNTSALSWLRFAARCHEPAVRHLAYFAHLLLALSRTAHYTQVVPCHIKGTSNGEADGLSRPELFPSMDSVIAEFFRLQTCHPCQLPSKLLSTIARTLLCDRIEAPLE